MTAEWMERAVCAQEEPHYADPENPVRIARSILFYFFEGYENDAVIEHEGGFVHARDEATKMCSQCPVQWECLNYGITHDSTGVYAGMYLTNGKINYSKNDNRSPEEWAELRKKINDTKP